MKNTKFQLSISKAARQKQRDMGCEYHCKNSGVYTSIIVNPAPIYPRVIVGYKRLMKFSIRQLQDSFYHITGGPFRRVSTQGNTSKSFKIKYYNKIIKLVKYRLLNVLETGSRKKAIVFSGTN